MRMLISLFEKVEYGIFLVAKVALILLMLATTADAFMRYVFNQPIIGAYHFSEKYLMVIVVFFSISYVWKIGGHIRVDLFVQYIPKQLVKVIDIFYMILGALLMGAVSYQALIMTIDSFTNNQISTGIIAWPTWTSWVWLPIGGFMFTIRLLLEIALAINNFNKEENTMSVEEI